MRRAGLLLPMALMFTVTAAGTFARPAGEFLTEKEIESIQINQKIDSRVKLYLRAAALRLKSAEARLRGVETEPGDPLEYFTPEDMLDGYYRILNSVMLNMDDEYQKVNRDSGRLTGALKALRKSAKESLKQLEFLKQLAEKQQKKELLRLIEKAVDITTGAYEGASEALSENSDPSGKGE